MTTFSQNLDLRQSQNLVMTPQLQQAIKLLQLSNQELSEVVEKELAENPLLEKAAPEDHESETSETEIAAPERDDFEKNFDEGWTGNEAESKEKDFDPGSSMANVGAGGNANFDSSDTSFEDRMSRDLSLREHLLEQLHLDVDDPRDRLIGALLIDQLDESGYLRENHEALAERLGCSVERIEKLLIRMKGFDPTGVFAKDLPECLALQLEENGAFDTPMQRLLENLDLLAVHDIEGLVEKCEANESYVRDMIDEIKALNPKPSSSFDHFVVQTVVPDVLMKKLPKHLGGGWRVELNQETLPRVLVNKEYYKEVASQAKAKNDKEYLSAQLNSASWLVKALDQRAQTILKTASELVEQQNAFFLYGIEFLRPLTLKDIAEEIDMHESTVSRVTNNKYIGTPRGIFELKYFFSTALVGADGMSHSAESVKARIKNLIDAEDPKKILSDDKIVELLKQEHIDIARRTVAKYREALHIPSSVQRRKIKKNAS